MAYSELRICATGVTVLFSCLPNNASFYSILHAGLSERPGATVLADAGTAQWILLRKWNNACKYENFHSQNIIYAKQTYFILRVRMFSSDCDST